MVSERRSEVAQKTVGGALDSSFLPSGWIVSTKQQHLAVHILPLIWKTRDQSEDLIVKGKTRAGMAMALLQPRQQQQQNWFFIDLDEDGGICEVEVDVVGWSWKMS